MKMPMFASGCVALITVTLFTGVAMTQDDSPAQERKVNRGTEPTSGTNIKFPLVPADQPFPAYRRPVTTEQPSQLPRPYQQSDDFFDSPSIPIHMGQAMRPRTRTRTLTETYIEAVPQEEIEEARKLQASIETLKTSQSETEKQAAAKTIQQQLKRQFDRDLKQREKELAEVEKRVLKLRQQLDKRKAAEKDIINLRLQTLVNEANGLGFPANNLGYQPSPRTRIDEPVYYYNPDPPASGDISHQFDPRLNNIDLPSDRFPSRVEPVRSPARDDRAAGEVENDSRAKIEEAASGNEQSGS